MELGARFRSLVEGVPDAMLAVDGGGTVVLFNGLAEDLFRCPRGGIVGRSVDLLLPEARRDAHRIHRAGYLGNPVTRPMGATLPLEARRWDGTTFPAEISLSSVDEGDGLLIFAAVRDVSRQRQADSTFRALLESAPDAMVMVDATGTITMVNGQAEQVFGWPRQELLGQPVEVLVPDSLRHVHPHHRSRYLAWPVTRPMGAGLELEGRRRDGTAFPAEISLSTLDTPEGPLVSAAIRDVTARHDMEREARAARAEAERANVAKSEFLSRMSHELRTPLNAILGFAQLLEHDEPRPDQARNVAHILAAGRHLLTLVDEVLDISRIESGALALALEAVHLAGIVRETVDLVMPLAIEQQVQLRIDPRAAPRCAVLADRRRLRQVLLNLASNAVKYNHVGGEVTISWTGGEDDGVRLEVRDTGVGIPAELLDRLFSPFERLDQAGSGVDGTGLGLALSKGLMQAMHGDIGVTSSEGEGSLFWVSLAPAVPPDVLAPPGPGAGAGAGAGARIPPDGLGKRILYVEDNLSNLQLVEGILHRRPDLELVPAAQGSVVVQLARRYRPDLVLLDLHLPDIGGEEVLVRLRADPVTAAIPVVVVSADALPARVQELRDRGAAGYLTKPFEMSVLLDLVDRLLSGTGTGTGTGAGAGAGATASAPGPTGSSGPGEVDHPAHAAPPPIG